MPAWFRRTRLLLALRFLSLKKVEAPTIAETKRDIKSNKHQNRLLRLIHLSRHGNAEKMQNNYQQAKNAVRGDMFLKALVEVWAMSDHLNIMKSQFEGSTLPLPVLKAQKIA